MTDTKLEAEICFAAHKPDALRLALEYAGEDGFVASMPQLMHARPTTTTSSGTHGLPRTRRRVLLHRPRGTTW